MNNTENKRLFIAVPLPPAVQAELQRIVRLLKKENICDGTYANLRDAHVTLQFLGSINEQEIGTIDTALQAISYQKCPAHLGPIGSFSKRGRIAIIYGDILSPMLTGLAPLLQHAIAPWIAKNEDRPFVAHVTLLRVKKIYDEAALRAFLEKSAVQPIAFMIDSFVLMESILMPDGPVYKVINHYELL